MSLGCLITYGELGLWLSYHVSLGCLIKYFSGFRLLVLRKFARPFKQRPSRTTYQSSLAPVTMSPSSPENSSMGSMMSRDCSMVSDPAQFQCDTRVEDMGTVSELLWNVATFSRSFFFLKNVPSLPRQSTGVTVWETYVTRTSPLPARRTPPLRGRTLQRRALPSGQLTASWRPTAILVISYGIMSLIFGDTDAVTSIYRPDPPRPPRCYSCDSQQNPLCTDTGHGLAEVRLS